MMHATCVFFPKVFQCFDQFQWAKIFVLGCIWENAQGDCEFGQQLLKQRQDVFEDLFIFHVLHSLKVQNFKILLGELLCIC